MRAKRANSNLELAPHMAATCASKGMALGAAVTGSSYRAEGSRHSPSAIMTTTKRGLLIKARAGRVVTPEQVRDLAEDEAR